MRNAIRNTLVATAAVPLLFGCEAPSSSSDVSPAPTHVQSDEQLFGLSRGQQEHIQHVFDRDVAYWKARGIGAITNTKLVILGDPAARFNCPSHNPDEAPATYTMQSNNSLFCDTKNTIIIVGKSIRAQLAIGGKQPGADFIVNHEVGHSVQDAENELDPEVIGTPQQASIENQATCYAGNIAAEFDSASAIAATNANIKAVPTDPEHGSSASQSHAYLLGVHGGSCEPLLTR